MPRSKEGGQAPGEQGQAQVGELKDRAPGGGGAELEVGRLVVEDEGKEKKDKESAKPAQRRRGRGVDLGLIIGKGLTKPVQGQRVWWGLAGPLSFDEGEEHDLEIQQHVPVLDVVQVEADPLGKVGVPTQAVDLRPARDAGLDVMAGVVVRDLLLELL